MSKPPDIPTEKPPEKIIIRPWGSFKQYAYNENVTISLMSVKPGQRLSLQSHKNRSELWIALDEGSIIQVGDKIYHPRQGDEFWIPVGEKHRLSCSENSSREARVLEVAFGNWQQEDIVRYEDDYQRPEECEG